MAISGAGRPLPAAARISRHSSFTCLGSSRLREKRTTPAAVPSRSQEARRGGTDLPSNPAIRNGKAKSRFPVRSITPYFTDPIVNPAMNRSRKKVYTTATGMLAMSAPAISGPHWNTSPRTSSVGTPMETVFLAETEMKVRA